MNKTNNNIVIKALRLAVHIIYPRSYARKVFAALGLAPMATTFALFYAYFYLDLPESMINGVWTVNYVTYGYAAFVTVIKCLRLRRKAEKLIWLDRLAIFISAFALASTVVIGFIVWTFCN